MNYELRITKLSNYQIIKLLNYQITKLPNYQIIKLTHFQITKLLNYQFMLKYIYLLCLTVLFFISKAQDTTNLVPNSGFEEYDQRHEPRAFFDQVKHWFSPGEAKNYSPYPTPDHFIETQMFDQPGAIKYYHIFADSAIAGIITYMRRLKNYREYISVPLRQPLKKNTIYEISMYVLTPITSSFANIISNGLGIHFSTESLKQNLGNYIRVKPHFQLKRPLNAKKWQKITATIVSDSSYKFLTIGNFLPDYRTQTIYSGHEIDPQSYFFIDNVQVIEYGFQKITLESDRTISPSYSSIVKNKHISDPKNNLPVTLKGRLVYQQNRIKTNTKKVTIKIWDKREVDGDVISLKFNDTWLLENYTISKHKKTIELILDPNRQNYLIVFAENLGKKPPNTAAFVLKTGKKKKFFSINSDFRQCGAIKLDYKEPIIGN